MASKAAEREAADRQAARDREHAAILRGLLLANADMTLLLRDVATVLDERAEHVDEVKRKGWQTRGRELRSAAGYVRELVDLLDTNPAPVEPRREPLDKIPGPDQHANLDPADGPISAQITDRVLAMRNGERCRAEYRHRAGLPGARTVRCGRTAGHDLPPAATRHAEWIKNESDDPEGPIAGGDWGPEWDMPTPPTPTGGYVTPAMAAQIGADVRARLAAAGPTIDDKLAAAFDAPDVAVVMCGEPPFLAGLQAAINAEALPDVEPASPPDPGERTAGPGPWVSAAYYGQCSTCGNDFSTGDDIRADGDGGWEARDHGHDDERRDAIDAALIHIRTFPADVNDPAGSVVNWCAGSGGPAGTPEQATCQPCIAEYRAAVRYGPGTSGEPLTVSPGASAFIGEVREYRVGDTVNVGGIEFVKHSEFDPGDGGLPVTVLGDPVPAPGHLHELVQLGPGVYAEGKPVVVLVTGSRGWTEPGIIHDTLAGLAATVPTLIVRHGDCPTGADAIARGWCDTHLPPERQQRRAPNYEQHGSPAAPHIRNSAMLVEEPRPMLFLAFWDGRSPGTRSMIDKCRAAGVNGMIYGPDPGSPPIEVIAQTGLPVVEVVDVERRRPDRPTRRLTHDEVRTIGLAQTHRRQRRSLSQVTGWEECGTKYAIRHFDYVPSWWNVGGSAVHARIEEINRFWAAGGNVGQGAHLIPFEEFFTAYVAETEYLTGVPHEAWRAAKKGSEAYDFWRVTGAECVDRWVEHVGRRRAAGWAPLMLASTLDRFGLPATPVIEWEYPLPMTADGSTPPDTTILDLALTDGRSIEIVDIKAGARPPSDGFQLATYAWSLEHALRALGDPRATLPIAASYWMARTGELLGPHDPRPAWPWPAILARFQAMHAGESAGVYPAKVTNFCRSCGVYDLCPAQVDQTHAPS